MTNGTITALTNIAVLGFTVAVVSPLAKGLGFMNGTAKKATSFFK